MDLAKKLYTIDDIYNLPEGHRAELIDGVIYNMAPPSRKHQKIVSGLTTDFNLYIRSNNGDCEVYPSPFAVFLNHDDYTYVEPDLSIICNKDKLDDRGCNGAPDLIIEVTSPSSKRMDYIIKLFKYRSSGVREYWIIDPERQNVHVYLFGENETLEQYSFDDLIPVGIYQDLQIRIADYIS